MMNDVAWYWQILIWLLVGGVFYAAYSQIKYGSVGEGLAVAKDKALALYDRFRN